MASVPRGLVVRVVSLAVRSRTAALLPTRMAPLSTWRALSSVSYPAWKQQDRACTSRPSIPVLYAGRVPQISSRWSSTTTLTVRELEEQVVAVLKMFDKVKPEKVNERRC